MKILTAQEMVNIDQKTMQDYQIGDLVLMENAGISVFQELERLDLSDKKTGVFVGHGNNGGDGLVIARQLFSHDYSVVIFYIGDKKKASKSNKKNLSICKKLRIPIVYINHKRYVEKYADQIKGLDICVDAIFGIGLKTPLKEHYHDLINLLNSVVYKMKIAVDIPSGLFADNPLINSGVFQSDITVTFGAPKIAHIISPARSFVGKLIVKNIGFPKELLYNDALKINLITKEYVNKSLPQRVRYYHKNDFGHVVTFTGSKGKSGASILAAQSALKSGAGLVTSVVPQEINDIIESSLIEVMTSPVDLSDIENSFNHVSDLFIKADVILCGCGIGVSDDARAFLKKILSLEEKIIVLDADALNIISDDLSIINSKNQYVFTPHMGEMCRLTGLSKEDIIKAPVKTCQDFASKYHVILVLKSSETIIAHPDQTVFINSAGNEGMATAGSGDVLAGCISGLSAQAMKQERNIFSSVVSSVFIHALAGDIAYKEKGSHSLIASEIMDNFTKGFDCVKIS